MAFKKWIFTTKLDFFGLASDNPLSIFSPFKISKTINDVSMELSSQKPVSFAPIVACFYDWIV